MLVGSGGDQSYGSNSGTGYPAWTTAGVGTAARAAIQSIGAWDIAILSGVFEGWDTSGARDRENLTQSCLKNCSYSVPLSVSRICLPFYYHIHNQGMTAGSGGGYQQFINQVVAMNGWMYNAASGGGSIVSANSGSNNLINYATAWPTGIGSASLGQSIVGANYGSTSSGSPTGAQGIARMSGNYAAIKLLMKGYTGDSRFSFGSGMGSPSCGGISLDNLFLALDGGGGVANCFMDGISSYPGSQTGGGYPALDTAQPIMARGNRNFFDQLQVMVQNYGTPGKTFYNFGNFGQYANNYQFGTAPFSAGLDNLQGGLLEGVFGNGASSWEWQCFGGFATHVGWRNTLTNYYQGMDFCLNPKLVGMGIILPATDGSTTASFGVAGTLTTVSTGTALEYQLLRYGLCTTLLENGYAACGVSGSGNSYNWAVVRWYDEFGDDSLTQVNVPRGYLGYPVQSRPTAPMFAQGTLGVWGRWFQHGLALVNPRGNGSQTVALGTTCTKLTGSQQPSINSGATVTSVTLGDGDGIILLH